MLIGTIGRKIYLNWGEHIIAIEKYPMSEELCDQIKFDSEHNISIFDIKACLDQKFEQYVGRPNCSDVQQKMLGYTISEYFTADKFWATSEEFKELVHYQTKKCREELDVPDDTYEFEEGDVLTDTEYKEVTSSCLHVRCANFENDESFWCCLFREQDYETYKNCEEKSVLFVAMNNTLSGHECGKVYEGKILYEGSVQSCEM